ncbi:outer membrane lipoprotein-sorting protein [Paenibacillus massiliensis]|uniref:outer membrane lipoprotein-sorting protein n=1 Tax=Paenibacillus massiliensis TaxID=225917 RepID=UPI0004759989|nr:outer membrane lipoprotein-sorting protein [Paenibacillus massiliensis]
MRRSSWMLAMIMCVIVLVAGCGKKSADDVVKDLSNVVSGMDSYHGTALMTLHTGETPQEYLVDVSYRKPSYYRIAMTNENKDVTQIVLRNDEGVFVLTPSLNKSFRFKSDWPDNQGQVYLYETLVRSIIGDKTRQLASGENAYVFDVAANYNSSSLVRQKIWLNKENYAPQQVQVSDANAKVLVDLKFSDFKFGTKFNKDAFDMERNMTAGSTAVPQAGTPEASGAEAAVDTNNTQQSQEPGSAEGQGEKTDEATGNEQQGTSSEGAEDKAGSQQPSAVEPSTDSSTEQSAEEGEGVVDPTMSEFGLIEPTYLPEGVQMRDMPVITDSSNHAVMIRYEGQYNFTIVEARPQDRAVSLSAGSLIDMGFGVMGVLTGDQQRTLTWMNDGVEFRITSADLPVSEMTKIAASMQDQSGK